MEYYETSNTINATPEQIWEVLTDARGMTDWDSGVEIEGTIAPGQKLKLHIEANPGRAFSLKVVEFDPGQTDGVEGRHATWVVHRRAHVHPDAGRRRYRIPHA